MDPALLGPISGQLEQILNQPRQHELGPGGVRDHRVEPLAQHQGCIVAGYESWNRKPGYFRVKTSRRGFYIAQY